MWAACSLWAPQLGIWNAERLPIREPPISGRNANSNTNCVIAVKLHRPNKFQAHSNGEMINPNDAFATERSRKASPEMNLDAYRTKKMMKRTEFIYTKYKWRTFKDERKREGERGRANEMRTQIGVRKMDHI